MHVPTSFVALQQSLVSPKKSMQMIMPLAFCDADKDVFGTFKHQFFPNFLCVPMACF